MDLRHIIRQLNEEKTRLEATIALLESLGNLHDSGRPMGSRRGRKSMGEVERRDVSERMKRYWASKRSGRDLAGRGNPT
jgi:hypothetical protein